MNHFGKAESERTRFELLAALDEAEADLRERNYSEYTDTTLPQLAEELKGEARASRDRTESARQAE